MNDRRFRVASTNCHAMTLARGHRTYLVPVERHYQDGRTRDAWRAWWWSHRLRVRAARLRRRVAPRGHRR